MQGIAKRPLKSQMAIMVETTHRFELRARSGHTMALYLQCNGNTRYRVVNTIVAGSLNSS